MSDPGAWTIDTVHLGTQQLKLSYDAKDQAAVVTPMWSEADTTSSVVGNRNIEHSKLHVYQLKRPIQKTDSGQP